MADFSYLKHPKEKTYFTIMAVISAIVWFVLIPVLIFTLAFSIMVLPLLFIGLCIDYVTNKVIEAVFLGDSIKVSSTQYPEIYKIVNDQCAILGIKKPEVHIMSESGINAIALKLLTRKYVLLYASLVDLMLKEGDYSKLGFVIGHELGHHATGHLSTIKSKFLIPGKLIPFLGPAYSRACEYTADRYGAFLIQNNHDAAEALALIALGSKQLSSTINVDAFADQHNNIDMIIEIFAKAYRTHPLITSRVIAIKRFQIQPSQTIINYSLNTSFNPVKKADPVFQPSQTTSYSQPISKNACYKCNSLINPVDMFCGNCGAKL